MARCEPHVSCINIKKISKIKNISQFGLEQNVRERDKEKGEKKAQASPKILRGFASQNSAGRKVKLLCDESYTWVPESQDFAKVQGSSFNENREKVMSREITLFEVGFFSYLV